MNNQSNLQDCFSYSLGIKAFFILFFLYGEFIILNYIFYFIKIGKWWVSLWGWIISLILITALIVISHHYFSKIKITTIGLYINYSVIFSKLYKNKEFSWDNFWFIIVYKDFIKPSNYQSLYIIDFKYKVHLILTQDLVKLNSLIDLIRTNNPRVLSTSINQLKKYKYARLYKNNRVSLGKDSGALSR